MVWKDFEENTKLISIETKVYVQKVGLTTQGRGPKDQCICTKGMGLTP